jgi:Polyketide cyclase / dehydrase and lipid transport
MAKQVLEQSIQINASAVVVDRCVTDPSLQRQWLGSNYEPMGNGSVAVGSYSRLAINLPLFHFTLSRIVIVREPGLVVWGFDGFITGRELWECRPHERGTLLVNRWELQTSNLIGWGWHRFARQQLTDEIVTQLTRLKYVAEEIHYLSGFQ